MEANKDYFYDANITTMSGPNTLKQIKGVMLGTKNYLFVIPQQTMGTFFVVTTFKNHNYFANGTVDEGCRKLIAESNSIEELEQTFINLLEDDAKYVLKLSDYSSVKSTKIFRTYQLTLRKSKMVWTACIIKGHDSGKAMREFFAFLIKK